MCPREISGLRIARSFGTPANAAVERVIDFQLGARQGIQIHSVLGTIQIDPSSYTPSTTVQVPRNGNQTLHLETGSLETVPDTVAEDEDTIDSEVFYRQDITTLANDDLTTEFRASAAIAITPSGIVDYARPLFSARNITHRSFTNSSGILLLCHVTIFYTFVEFSLAELGLILARRT